MNGFIVFPRREAQLTTNDYSVLRLLEAAKEKNIKLSVVTPNQFELVVTREDTKSILIDDKVTKLPDFIIPRMGSTTTYYAFSVIRQLEHLGIYVCNTANSIYTVKDKLYMHQILAYSRLPTPKTMLAKFPIDISVVKREIGLPIVIKNITGSQGNGIYLCESEEKFSDIMELLYSTNSNANIILQEFIEHSYGRDLRVFVLGGKVIGCMQRSSRTSFKANYSKGAEVSAFKLTPEIEWLSTETARLLDLDVAGIDLLFDKNGYKVCEANSSPGFKGLEKAGNKYIAESILDYITFKIGV